MTDERQTTFWTRRKRRRTIRPKSSGPQDGEWERRTVKLPQPDLLRVDESKVVEYLLSIDHPDGRSKARLFERFGFTAAGWTVFAAALKEHGRGNPVENVVETGHGTRYSVIGSIRSPDGRNPTIMTVWIVESGSDSPRLITAYPSEERK